MKKKRSKGLIGVTLALLFFATMLFVPNTASAFNTSNSSCYAYTGCPNGRTVWCEVYANSYMGTACSWNVVPGYSVTCNGYDYSGYWRYIHLTCY